MSQKEIIQQLIQVAGNQTKLAEIAECSQGEISEYLNEKRSLKVSRLLKICEKLNLKIEIYGSN